VEGTGQGGLSLIVDDDDDENSDTCKGRVSKNNILGPTGQDHKHPSFKLK
jgi:hypothetical protein